ncbi:MAG: 50S ribosomal protein L3 N(5)-glutamine methyltransferase [Gammaproteobacteria bacterium]|nr:50S ribosomal protein L3 N(5)-glutamine methyltransferase [Gammaproteobacteria bacterium]
MSPHNCPSLGNSRSPSQLITIDDCVSWADARLDQADVFFGHGCYNSRDEAIWATLHVAGLMDQEYDEIASTLISEQDYSKVRDLIERRIQTRQPLAYLIREAWFAGYRFYIDERAIVPRSHLGDLIQDGLEPWIDSTTLERALDLCCGSGCIAVALALTCPNLIVDASDLDASALEVSRINIDRFQVENRVQVAQSDLFQNLPIYKYDLIASNPPYIPSEELDKLPEEYLHEPTHAFAGGEDGLKFVRQILIRAADYLSDKGHLLIELGNNADALESAYPDFPFLWLTSRSEESVVVLLSKEELQHYEF